MLLGLAASPSDVRRAERGPGGAPGNGGGAQPGTAPGFPAAPEILGTGRIGTELTVQPGAVTGDPAPDLSFQWQRDGADIAGAGAPIFLVRPEDDLAELSCRVSATNPSGTAMSETPVVIARHTPPVAGTIPDAAFLRGTGNQNINTTVGFMGENLRFSINAVIGVTIDPQTGMVTVNTNDPMAATAVTVTAVNSGGADSASFSLVVQEPPAFGALPQILGEARIGSELALAVSGVTGTPVPALSYEWRRDGVAIAGATGAVYTLQPADDLAGISCRITAANLAGSAAAETAVVAATYPAPEATATLADRVFQQNTGMQTIEAAPAFAGAALVYSVAGPDGIAIDAATGAISVATADPLAGATVTVTAANSGGTAEAGFALTVEEAIPAPVLTALSVDAGVVPPVVSFQTDQDGLAHWMVTAEATATAAAIRAGGGEAGGQVAVNQGVVTEDVDLGSVATGVPRYFHVMLENANGASNVLSLAFELEEVIPPVAASGGTVSEYTDANGDSWRAHVFAANGTLEVTAGGAVEYLIVGGGGAGGFANFGGGGGGAGGDVLTGSLVLEPGSHAIAVGAGGTASATTHNAGASSAAFGLTALGGGRGAASSGTYRAAAAGGGGLGRAAAESTAGATHPTGSAGGAGFNGIGEKRAGGGGRGAGGNGQAAAAAVGGAGGAGVTSDITGASVAYGRGGGGGVVFDNTAGTPGTVGAPNGGRRTSNGGTASGIGGAGATPGSGGGGGAGAAGAGASDTVAAGGPGAAGLVVVRYAI